MNDDVRQALVELKSMARTIYERAYALERRLEGDNSPPAPAGTIPSSAPSRPAAAEYDKCPVCQSHARQRRNPRTDQWFWGCADYPSCKWSAPMRNQPSTGIPASRPEDIRWEGEA